MLAAPEPSTSTTPTSTPPLSVKPTIIATNIPIEKIILELELILTELFGKNAIPIQKNRQVRFGQNEIIESDSDEDNITAPKQFKRGTGTPRPILQPTQPIENAIVIETTDDIMNTLGQIEYGEPKTETLTMI